MAEATVRGTRRSPVQERSQETVQRILEASSRLLTEIPLEQMTTIRIAEAAGLSVGALYRFFPDKQAIIDAIAVRRIEEFAASMEGGLDISTFDGPTLLGTVLDRYIEFLDAHPDFRTIAFGQLISASTHHRHAQPNAPGARIVKRFMAGSLGFLDSEALDVRLRIVIEAGERLIAYAYEQPTRPQRDEVIEELKRMLAGYLFPTHSEAPGSDRSGSLSALG